MRALYTLSDWSNGIYFNVKHVYSKHFHLFPIPNRSLKTMMKTSHAQLSCFECSSSFCRTSPVADVGVPMPAPVGSYGNSNIAYGRSCNMYWLVQVPEPHLICQGWLRKATCHCPGNFEIFSAMSKVPFATGLNLCADFYRHRSSVAKWPRYKAKLMHIATS